MSSRALKTLAAVLPLVGGAVAQSNTTEVVWSSVAYILYGDHTPLQGDTEISLTPLGAQQLYSQGSLFRARYLSSSALSIGDNALTTNSPITNIEPNALDNAQLSLYSTTDDYVVGSALAFLQGLYPPVNGVFASSNGGASTSVLANGSTINFPLGGYQYPNVRSLPITDANSIWLEGHSSCVGYMSSANEFRVSSTSRDMRNATSSFYESTWDQVFPNSLPRSMLNFDYAYDLYDYAQYAYVHDQAVRDALGPERLEVLHNFASIQQFDLNANLTASGARDGDMIRAIAGRTLAGRVVSLLSTHIASAGTTNQLSLLFGSFEPMLAFFALAELDELPEALDLFRQIPLPGSAMLFELFEPNSNGTVTRNATDFPDRDRLWVRFLFRNGTGSDAPITEYPLFGRSSANARMRWTEFVVEMNRFSVRDVSSWCELCQSMTLFCSALTDYDSDGDGWSGGAGGSSGGTGSSSSNASLSPAVAGVIGAVTGIAVAILVVTSAFVFGGLHIRRDSKKSGSGSGAGAGKDESNDKSSSTVGGFKGAEKLESDRDVSVARNGVRHERVGSWELGGPGRPGAGTGPQLSVPAPTTSDNVLGGSIVRRFSKDDDDDEVISLVGRTPVKPLEGV
ncbi:phosphoglycerate mutase-like protein [Durotheca rogersii]|uniref:phosphoglycerate mutase-like protein n=1 Tax=Durotheca rogersii TaxID=419775 RepID=UPI00221FB956|nr:phosphoglycerate mutase-like protein [Durotheca rogersii]KAI5860391.1 phosphoglycerate mutase-like protein [Durotheca rogersii]